MYIKYINYLNNNTYFQKRGNLLNSNIFQNIKWQTNTNIKRKEQNLDVMLSSKTLI